MAIKVKNGNIELTLKKSSNLVGLQTQRTRGMKKYIAEQHFQNLGGFKVVQLEKGEQDIDSKLDEVRSYDEVELGTHVYYAAGSNRPIVPTGDLFIQFAEGTSEEEQKMVLDYYNLEFVERDNATFMVARVTANSPNPLKVAAQLSNISLVKSIEPDLDMPLDSYEFITPDDKLMDHQWHLRNSGFVVDVNWRLKKGADAKIVDAWQRLGNTGSSEVVVAVIDNGFDLTHPDLKHKVYRPFNVWRNNKEVLQGDKRYTHGTPCASVALADSNGRGIVGVAPNTRFMPVHGTSFSASATRRMFGYCAEKGADVISCSWGTTDPNFALNNVKKNAIAKAAKEGRNGKGCIILFAVGNDDVDYVNFYASHPDVIAVAASTSQDSHASYSNRGMDVTVCAPSNGDWPITAARAWWDEGVKWETGAFKYWRDGRSRGDHYKHFGGTSSACPLVAGICALMLSANPELTAKQVKDILKKTADKIGNPSDYSNGHSAKYGHGRVNADKAVAEALRLKDAGHGTSGKVQNGISKGKGLFRFSVKEQTAQGWGVQIGAFSDYGNVLTHAERLERQFKAPVIVNINEISGRTVYKIVVGAFHDINQARRLESQMNFAGVRGFLRNLADL